MIQSQFLRLNPLGLALGCAAAALAAIVARVLTFGFAFGLGTHRMGMMEYGYGYAGFGLLAAIGFIIFCALLGAIVAWTYNATAGKRF